MARAQARAFQSIPYYWGRSDEDAGDLYPKLSHALFMDEYLAASRELSAPLEFPTFHQEAGTCTDLPEVAGSWRVGVVSYNAVFPPLWRVRALRTFLPGELSAQLAQWREWVDALRRGDHRSYLLDLFLHATARTHRLHWNQLVDLAYASLSKETNWARKPEFVAVREEVLHFPRPGVPDLALEPPKEDGDAAVKDERATWMGDQARELVRLTRAWDAKVKSGWKLRWYEDAYVGYDVDSFLAAATDRLGEFFAWVEECDQRGFGLYLDY